MTANFILACAAEPDIATPKSGAVSPLQALWRQFSDADAKDLRRRHQEMADQVSRWCHHSGLIDTDTPKEAPDAT